MGDPDFEEYFAGRAQRLRRLAHAMCGDWHEAEDMSIADAAAALGVAEGTVNSPTAHRPHAHPAKGPAPAGSARTASRSTSSTRRPKARASPSCEWTTTMSGS
ncbi:hypothetical protein [Actinocrispum sp. NPDC049592]|uniref:hypothetical protein n=1 Tax=Actinocrispum sp. NPDC049592 TaxID=3154835 RepID=UPI00341C0849